MVSVEVCSTYETDVKPEFSKEKGKQRLYVLVTETRELQKFVFFLFAFLFYLF